MTFHVGQKVVCVGTFDRIGLMMRIYRFFYPFEEARTGQVYTVSNIYFIGDKMMLEIVELPTIDDGVWAPGYYARGFRPAVERKTDISVFKAMLKSSKVRA